MKQLKLSRLFSLLLALTLALTPCLAGLAEEGSESQNSMDIVLMSGTEDGAGEGTGEGGSGADGGDQPTNVPGNGRNGYAQCDYDVGGRERCELYGRRSAC